MYRLQDNDLSIPYGRQGVNNHYSDEENTDLLAWIEGWADAIKKILCAVYWQNNGEYPQDKESRLPLVNNGIRSESYIANAIYDLWDGANKYLPTYNPRSQTHGWNDVATGMTNNYNLWQRSIDDVEFSLSQICAPLQMTVNGTIGNVGQYISLLFISNLNNQKRSDILRVFRENRVVWNVENYNAGIELGSVVVLLPRDTVIKEETGFLYNLVTKHVDWNLITRTWTDTFFLNPRNTAGNTDIHFPATSNSQSIIDSYWIGYRNANGSENYPKNLYLNNVSNIASINYTTCGQTEILVRNGSMYLGNANATRSANLHISNKCLLSIEEYGNLILYPNSSITIESGGTLHLKAGSHLTLSSNANIYLETGSYICIENGANIDLLNNAHIIVNSAAYIG
jgi:hypothetical protein